MKKRIGIAIGIGSILLAVLVVNGIPAQSGQSVESRLRERGLPADAELGVVAMDSHGVFWDVTYFDPSGKEHVLLRRKRPEATPAP